MSIDTPTSTLADESPDGWGPTAADLDTIRFDESQRDEALMIRGELEHRMRLKLHAPREEAPA